MGTSKKYLLFITLQLIYAISAQKVVKRVPQGFVGLRGKKYVDSEEIERFYKRKPQFFVGVKGKKNFLDSPEELEYLKRAPMGFVGMRGKKFGPEDGYPDLGNNKYGSLIGQIDYSANDDENSNTDLGPNFPLLRDIVMRYLQLNQAPGPQVDQPDLKEELEQTKEADTQENNSIQDTEEDRITNEVKRANIHQFFGVRGKKSIQAKRPYDLSFRGKFIGVRGKKDLKNSGAQEIRFLLDGPWPKRKAQMGFFGMRGKKWTDESTSAMETPY